MVLKKKKKKSLFRSFDWVQNLSPMLKLDAMWAEDVSANLLHSITLSSLNPYPTAFPYGNGMVLHFYQQQESSTTKTVHKVINKGLKTYV